MDVPNLTNTQHAYYFNRDNFLNGITTRAGRLFEDGYQVTPHPFEPLVFTVSKRDGTEYDVNPVAKTCTCPFFAHQETAPLALEPVLCKHLHGLPLLVMSMLTFLEANRELRAFRTLEEAWAAAQPESSMEAVTPAA